MLNVKNGEENAFNVLMTLLNFLQKEAAGKVKKLFERKSGIFASNFENNELSNSILNNKFHSKLDEPEDVDTLPSTYLHNTELSPAKLLWIVTRKHHHL